MTYTPGYWVSVGAWVEHPNSDIPDICVCDPNIFGQQQAGLRTRSYEEQCANARLIAAAPSMLEILKRVAEAPADGTLDEAIFDASQLVAELGL